ncbi:MAG TPA: hypothetical protein VJT32_08030 [bacterium]|nr:hypothetical protein [bacterium]
MTKTKTDVCQMCGAVPGFLHHDQSLANREIVVLVKHEGPTHQGELLCQPCQQGTLEMELENSPTPEGLLARAARLQTGFWEALSNLEAELGFDIESTRDLNEVTVEDLKAEQEDEEEDDVEDDGDGALEADDEGRARR